VIREAPPRGAVRVHDDLAWQGGYDVHVERGALQRLDTLLDDVAGAAAYAVIADDRVAALHGATAIGTLSRRAPAELFTFPAGEANKTRDTWATLTDAMLARGLGRDSCVVALGGGVTGDLAGFVAATYLRGVALVQVPTSLLAMIDASIGGKTAVDVEAGKNLVGAFHPPRLVVVDPAVLDTLPDAQLRAGLAEAVKHGAIADAELLNGMPALAPALLARDPDVLDRSIRRSVEIKAEVVSDDPRETGRRAVLNFGHTIGHAIERVSGYTVPHGFAVAKGMVLEARIGEAAGITAPGTAAALARVLSALGLPTGMPRGMSADAVLEATRTDKKARASRVRYALLNRIGWPARTEDGGWTIAVDDGTVRASLAG